MAAPAAVCIPPRRLYHRAMSVEGWILMVGLRVLDLGLLAAWLVWFFRMRDDDSDDEGPGRRRPRHRSPRRLRSARPGGDASARRPPGEGPRRHSRLEAVAPALATRTRAAPGACPPAPGARPGASRPVGAARVSISRYPWRDSEDHRRRLHHRAHDVTSTGRAEFYESTCSGLAALGAVGDPCRRPSSRPAPSPSR